MNSSGLTVKSISKKHNLKPENIFVVHDDIDLDVLVHDAGVLGADGDAALALQVHRIHDALLRRML